MVALISLAAPPELRDWKSAMSQTFVAIGLCMLLTDALFLKVTSLPFTGESKAPATNLAFILLQYFGFFPPLVLLTVALEPWLEASLWHMAATVGCIVAAHVVMRRANKKNAEYYANLIDLDDDEEEFPQRLGLRY
jgi:cbb3-type cytochrome oxidase subunit 3